MANSTGNSISIDPSRASGDKLTYWERVALQGWGKYTSDIERSTIEHALGMIPTPTRALEVGCEGGRWSRLLADRGWQVVCTDINQESLRKCQERIPEAQCVLVQPSDTTLPCANETCALLLCIEVFPVMASTWFPAEASRVLGDNGIMIGVYLNRRSLRGAFVHLRMTMRRRKADSPDHSLYPRSYVDWKKTLQQYSFEVVYEQGYCWFPFPRTSNSPFIPFCTQLESSLGLRNVPALSPWVAFIARKSKPRLA